MCACECECTCSSDSAAKEDKGEGTNRRQCKISRYVTVLWKPERFMKQKGGILLVDF